ncbi:MAG: AraC family transcriptional regulator, partial [Roseobacter sp.]
CLTVLRRGAIENRVGDTRVEADPGTILINSLASSFSGTTDRIECINVLMNRDFFFDMETDIDALVNTRLEGPAARILSDFVLSSEKLFADLTISETSLWIESFSHLLGAVLRHQRERMPSVPVPRDRASIVLDYIRDNLHSPKLGAQSICLALRMSRRQLYYLLAPYGGVASLITRKRLVAACKALASREECRLISTVAYSLGFSDHAVFCKQFREEFGFSPSHARDSGICGYLPRNARSRLVQWLSDDAPIS